MHEKEAAFFVGVVVAVENKSSAVVDDKAVDTDCFVVASGFFALPAVDELHWLCNVDLG